MKNNLTHINRAQRIFMPGDKWLYYKLYSGPKTLESVLTHNILPLTRELISQEKIDNFFFIRYTDPDYHLRIRFRSNLNANHGTIIHLLSEKLKKFVDSRLIWKVSIDCYKREIERYGNNSIEYVEHLFHLNSMAILSIINHEENTGDKSRWLWGVKYIDMLLNEFLFSIYDKVLLFEQLSDGYGTEFNLSKPLRLSLDKKFRKNRSSINHFVHGGPINDNTEKKLLDILEKSIKESRTSIGQILKLKKEGQLEVPLNNLLGSILHMHYNRLFRTQQRMCELVIYYSMYKFYKSTAARMEYDTNKKIMV